MTRTYFKCDFAKKKFSVNCKTISLNQSFLRNSLILFRCTSYFWSFTAFSPFFCSFFLRFSLFLLFFWYNLFKKEWFSWNAVLMDRSMNYQILLLSNYISAATETDGKDQTLFRFASVMKKWNLYILVFWNLLLGYLFLPGFMIYYLIFLKEELLNRLLNIELLDIWRLR